MVRTQKTIFVITSYWPLVKNKITGIFIVQQVAALCRAGYQITIIVGKPIGKFDVQFLSPAELGLPADQVSLVQVPVLRVPEALSANALAVAFNIRSVGYSLSRIMARLSQRGSPQGCIVHGLRYYGLAAPYWSPDLQCQKIAVLHGVEPFLSRPSVARSLASYLHRAQSCYNKIILVGSPLLGHAINIGMDPSKVAVIPNGTDIPDLAYPPARANDDEVIRIISVSNLVALKGIDVNIRALAFLREKYGIDHWNYTIIGGGPEQERLQKLVRRLGLIGHIRFLGRISYERTMMEINEADIFSLPSWGEAFGIVYLEAMARRKATIGCLENGAADIITSGDDGLLVSPKNVEELADALRKLIANAEYRKDMGIKARSTAERFTWDNNVRRVLEELGV